MLFSICINFFYKPTLDYVKAIKHPRKELINLYRAQNIKSVYKRIFFEILDPASNISQAALSQNCLQKVEMSENESASIFAPIIFNALQHPLFTITQIRDQIR